MLRYFRAYKSREVEQSSNTIPKSMNNDGAVFAGVYRTPRLFPIPRYHTPSTEAAAAVFNLLLPLAHSR